MQHTTTLTDYSRDITLIRRLHSATGAVATAHLVCQPLAGLTEAVGFNRASRVFKGVSTLSTSGEHTLRLARGVWAHRYGTHGTEQCPIIRSLWASSKDYVGTLRSYSSNYDFRLVYGVPVACEGYDGQFDFVSPATGEAIYARTQQLGVPWMVSEDAELVVDKGELSTLIAPETQRIIDRTRRFSSCRAWLLHGPPRGGKSMAARQIAAAIGGASWVRVCGQSASSKNVWKVLEALRPTALIFDDLDTNAGNESALLSNLERARSWAKVIVSTINVLPSGGAMESPPPDDPDTKPAADSCKPDPKHCLRGAVLAPGRCADEDPVEYRGLPADVREALAPGVPESQRGEDVLAAYLVEMQARVCAGVACAGDLEEMRRRMRAVGDR